MKNTLLDRGAVPIEELAKFALREGQRPRPIYQVHKWFARRFGSAFRALLIAAFLSEGSDFWEGYYNGVNWSGRTVLDPFVGGGTAVIEAMRLGADVIGIDVDSVACTITRFETHLSTIPKMDNTLEKLKRDVGEELAPYYQTIRDNTGIHGVLHYFWVQQIACPHCGEIIEGHPHYQLAYEAEGTKQWVFCPLCHEVQELDLDETHLYCKQCSYRADIRRGSIEKGKLTCPHCGREERLIDLAAYSHHPPQWLLFALELLDDSPHKKRVPMTKRRFCSATKYDQSLVQDATHKLKKRKDMDGALKWVPSKCIPEEGRSDNRLLKYGYRYYYELFNDRQLLHLSLLADAIDKLDEPIREAMIIAFSDHLTTNCMMSSYAFGWRRLSPLFSVRAYRHITRPVEINPWMDGIGRGTFPNAVHQIQRAIDWSQSPKEPLIKGGFTQVRDYNPAHEPNRIQNVRIVQRNAQNISFIADESVDLVLTDPPYFDNISYSELSDFFLPWLKQFGIISDEVNSNQGYGENLSAKGRNELSFIKYKNSITNCFLEIDRVLKTDGRAVFTYQHKTAGAWQAIASAISCTRLVPIQLLPLLGDGRIGPHKHGGSSKWDAVFVLGKDIHKGSNRISLSNRALHALCGHYNFWKQRLDNNLPNYFGDADKCNFYRACIVAGALGMFRYDIDSKSEETLIHLLENAQKYI